MMIDLFAVNEDYRKLRKEATRSLSALSCGYQEVLTKDHNVIRPQGRIDYQLIYIVKGAIHISINGHQKQYEQGHLIYFKPRRQQIYSYYAKEGTQAYWLHFNGGESEFLLNASNTKGPIIAKISNDAHLIQPLFDKIIREFQLRQANYSTYANLCAHELLILMSRSLKSHPSNNIDKYTSIERTITYMHKVYNQRKTLKDYANYASLSVSRFTYNFEAYSGMSPMKYLTSIRMENANLYLQNYDWTISEISSLVGYDDPLYFSRVFSKYFGLPPSKHRQR